MSRRLAACLLVALSGAALLAGDARAASNDKEVGALVDSVLQADYQAGKFADALQQLELGKVACEAKKACSPKVRARLYIAIGTVLAGGLKKVPEAKEAFAIALKEDPTANLVSDLVTPEIQTAFNDARGGTSASGGTAETKKGPAQRKPKQTYPGDGKPVRGWRHPEAFFYWDLAVKSEASQAWLDCADYAQASLAVENRQSTRFLAASCEQRAGLWVEALADYQTVAEAAPKLGIRDLLQKSLARLDEIKGKIPKIVIHKPARAEGLAVTMNDAEVPLEKLDGEIWVNPGQRTVKARATIDGVPMEFEQAVDALEGKTATVDLKLLPRGGKKDQAMMRCMLAAQTRDDFARCLNESAGAPSSVNLHMGLEVSGYHDTEHVDVITPAYTASIESPTGGWGVNASMLVDVVTAASADIIANASPRWQEVRYVPAIGGHKKVGDADLSLHANLSHEPDYLAVAVGGGVSVDLRQKTITPALSYEYSHDVSGRAGTPFSVFSHDINRHGFVASTTFVLDKATIVAPSFTAVFEIGDTSKPYRYIPMFAPDVAARVPVGLAIDAVNQNRLPIRALEQLPTNRQRWALAGLFAHRFSSSTLRLEERLYLDSWGLKATTTDAQYLIDVSDRVRLWPHLRFNAQEGVDFWQLAYVARPAKSGPGFSLPALRTGDKELGPLLGATGGFGARFALGSKRTWALGIQGDVLYNRFLDHLYLLDRIGFFGATTLEVDIE